MHGLKRMIIDFLTEIRIDNSFNETAWKEIYSRLSENVEMWKTSGSVPKSIVPYLLDLMSQLSGGSSFADDDTLYKMYNANIKMLELFYELYREEDNLI